MSGKSGHKTRKFKIVEKPQNNGEYKEFRLFDFQAFDQRDHTDETSSNRFQIRMFGINTDGETCMILVNNFKPFFYIQVPSHFNTRTVDELFNRYKEHKDLPPYFRKSEFVKAELETHQRLYEFTGNLSYKFVKLTFTTTRAFRQVKTLLQTEKKYPIYEGIFHLYCDIFISTVLVLPDGFA